MKQKMYFQKILSIFVAVILLSACGRSPDRAGTEDPGTTVQQPELSSSRTDGPRIRQVGTEDGAGQQAAGSEGVYELAAIFPESYNILYTDCTTNRQAHLCSSAGCDHAGDYCTSYVNAPSGNIPGLVFSDRRLYLIWPSAHAAFLPQIGVMDANGANRTALAQFKASQTIGAGWYLADENALYFLLEEDQNDGRFTQALCSMDKTNGNVHALSELEQGGWIHGWTGILHLSEKHRGGRGPRQGPL